MRARGWILVLAATVAVVTAEAQIRLIPQAKVDSARNVATEQVGMAFERTTIDFGQLAEEGGAWQGVVSWQNTEREQITITRITTSCGCLQVENDRSTVEAGGRGELRLTYHPKGHAGRVSQRIFVYTDRSGRRPAAVLTVQGVVRAAADRSGDHPHSRGELLLRQTWVRFAGEGVQTERIACMNGGAKPLKISADTLLSSPEIEVRTEPSILQAGEAGDLVITYTPRADERSAMPHRMRPRLFLTGVDVAPRERAIEVFTQPDEKQK